jgi:hypothetical protein
VKHTVVLNSYKRKKVDFKYKLTHAETCTIFLAKENESEEKLFKLRRKMKFQAVSQGYVSSIR